MFIDSGYGMGEWAMTPPTVNAYYDGQMNNINSPGLDSAAPFFNFDDEGRQFDAEGNLFLVGDRSGDRIARPRRPGCGR